MWTNFIRILPNALTICRLALTLVFLGMILYAASLPTEKPAAVLMAAFVIFVIAGITDIIDGPIARQFHVTSQFGRTVDPLADKILVVGAFLCFAVCGQPRLANVGWSDGTLAAIRWGTSAILLVREVLVQSLRHWAEARGVAFGAVLFGKIKMFVQSFGIGTVLIGWAFVSGAWGDWVTLVVYALVCAVTVLSGLHALKRPAAKKVLEQQ